MGNKITVSFFKCDTQEGDELFRRAKGMLEQMEIGGRKAEVVLRENNPFSATEAYLFDDIVIFDASLEDASQKPGDTIGSQYDAMLELMKSACHVLTVSRSQVPFNVTCAWKGGYPNYIKTGVAEYKETLDNGEILEWLRTMFLQKGENLVNQYKLDREIYEGLPYGEKMKALNDRAVENADRAAEAAEENAEVFISYLSRYSKYFPGGKGVDCGYTVEDLIAYIADTQNIPKEKIGYFPPGSLSRELMTVQRKWEIVSATDDFIRKCRQFWILSAPGYAKSWWTLSERVTLSYILEKEPENCPDIYVAKYHPESGSFYVEEYLDAAAKKKILPKLEESTVRELARYFANSRQGTVGYESVRPMRVMHHLPEQAIRFLSKRTYKLMEEYFPIIVEEMEMTTEEYEETAVQSSKSEVYAKSFWEDWIMECPYCKAQSSNGRYGRESFLNPGKSSFCQVVKERDFSYDAGKDRYTVVCRTCGHKFRLRKGFFYRWYPIRGINIRTGPGRKSVERKTAFYFTGEE